MTKASKIQRANDLVVAATYADPWMRKKSMSIVAELLGVNKGRASEALNRLETRGIVTLRQGSVIHFSEELFLEFAADVLRSEPVCVDLRREVNGYFSAPNRYELEFRFQRRGQYDDPPFWVIPSICARGHETGRGHPIEPFSPLVPKAIELAPRTLSEIFAALDVLRCADMWPILSEPARLSNEQRRAECVRETLKHVREHRDYLRSPGEIKP